MAGDERPAHEGRSRDARQSAVLRRVADLRRAGARAEQKPEQCKGGDDRGDVAASVHERAGLADGEA